MASNRAASAPRTRVVIVDDQDNVRRTLGQIVEAQPNLALVGTAFDVESGVELALRERPHVAIVDYRMPGGGPRLVRQIRASCPETRVVALSAYQDRTAVFEMLRAGAVSYLVKGEEIAEIVRTIERAADGESTLSASVTAEVLHELAHHLEERESSEVERRTRVARVWEAIDRGGIRPVYQPIVELASRQTVGFEALSRFAGEPAQGPGAWFADAAAVGLTLELERAALTSALAGLEQVPEDCFLSVNLGPEALLDDRGLELLASCNPNRMVLELTEHAAVDDYDVLRNALLDLRRQGLRLAVDDAGAGYASLRHVLSLAPDIIKLDISLIREIETDRGARALASALISFAEQMGQLVIAEGIEHERTVDVLESIGVRYGQGFLLGRPEALAA